MVQICISVLNFVLLYFGLIYLETALFDWWTEISSKFWLVNRKFRKFSIGKEISDNTTSRCACISEWVGLKRRGLRRLYGYYGTIIWIFLEQCSSIVAGNSPTEIFSKFDWSIENSENFPLAKKFLTILRAGARTSPSGRAWSSVVCAVWSK